MELDSFAAHCDLIERSELEKVELLAFYLEISGEVSGFKLAHICELFEALLYSHPNVSRLRLKIRKSKSFIKAIAPYEFRLNAKKRNEFSQQFAAISEPAEEAKAIDGIIPLSLVSGTRGYIVSLGKQINVSYENSAFDGAAVLMRRLVEVLLIHAFEHINKISEIKDSNGDTRNLNAIIATAVQSAELNLSKPVKKCLDSFRQLGNFSAHSIHYNAKRADIKSVALDYRVSVEELLYKGGLKT